MKEEKRERERQTERDGNEREREREREVETQTLFPVSFKTPSGQIVVVVLNKGDSSVTLNIKDISPSSSSSLSLSHTIEPHSITTFISY